MIASAPLNLGLFRVHRIFSCAFFGLALVVIGAGVSILLQGQDAGGVVFYGVFLIGFSAAHWYAGNGARDGKNYGRFLSRMFGMLWLIGFPITTVLGIYVLIRAGSTWTERAVPLDEAQ